MAGKAVVRIYAVESSTGSLRLVRAKSGAQALSHVVKNTFEVRMASQEDLVTGLTNKVQIEVAEEPLTDPAQLPLAGIPSEPSGEPQEALA